MATTTTPHRRRHRDLDPEGPSDAELLERVRAGDDGAYGELYVRHQPAATSLARYLTHARHEADDVVADAFARVLRAIRGGAGPTEAFRPYLLTAVRRTVWRRSEEAANAGRLASSEDEAEVLDLRLAVDAEDRSDEAIVLSAFQGLPERWQLVLWHTEIEGQPPAEVAPLLGLSPNATAALAVRAREGLRQAYLQAHLQSRPADACRFSVEHLGAFVREGLGKRDTAKVEQHLSSCTDCQELRSDLGSLNKALRGVVGPAVVGSGAAGWLRDRARDAATASAAQATEASRSVLERLRFPQAAGLAGAAATLLVTLGVSSDIARTPADASPAATPVADTLPLADVGPTVVDPTLVGTAAAVTPGVTADDCEGGHLPLSLPNGSTPTGASLVRVGDAQEPLVVDPATFAGFESVASGGATLVGSDGACVTNLIEPLDGAPANTALAVAFLDQLGDLQILIVPQVVDTVKGALQVVTDQAHAINQQLQAYADAVLAQFLRIASGVDGVVGAVTGPDGLPTLPGGGTGSGSGGGGTGDLELPPLPPAPALPPNPVGGVVDGVGDLVDGVGDLVDDTLGGLLG